MFASVTTNVRQISKYFHSERNRAGVLYTKYMSMSGERKDSIDVSQNAAKERVRPNSQEECDKPLALEKDSDHGDNEMAAEKLSKCELQAESLSFLPTVNEAALNPHQLAIHVAHVKALKAGELFYTDPATGYQVMTRLAHLQRGNCCGNACRHCPFDQKNAPEERRKTYNSAFYE